VTAEDGREFIDWGMALRACILGYAYKPVDDAAKKAIDNGVCFTRSNPYEGELKELLKSIIPCAEEVKLGKNGSDVTHAAVKLARAYTGRDLVLIAKENPFISTADFFIGTTLVDGGIPCEDSETVEHYSYNTLTDITHPREIYFSPNNKYEITQIEWLCKAYRPAAIVLDPSTVDITREKLQHIRNICDKYGIIMILDEVISGFRYGIGGVQGLYGVNPDLCTLGKAMGNGYAVSALCGKKELFDLGLRDKGNVFLLSGTYFSNTPDIAAAIACVKELQKTEFYNGYNDYPKDAVDCINQIGRFIVRGINETILKYNTQLSDGTYLSQHIKIKCHGNESIGIIEGANPSISFSSMALKTLFDQVMIQEGILMPYIAPSASHTDKEVNRTIEAVEIALMACKAALNNNYVKESLINGHCEKPVFRRT